MNISKLFRRRNASAWVLACWMVLLASEGIAADAFTYDGYAAVLASYVDDHGLAMYGELKAHPEKLNAFRVQVQGLDGKVYDGWAEKAKIAFWINAYNALTLKVIIDHYPIEASWKKALLYPRNSIRQISGVWDKLEFTVMGDKMTLDDIEHQKLRKEFDEPRIHMALVCAALSCPPLRNEPYVEDTLDDQLDDQARRFLESSDKFRIAREDGRVRLSSIFEWFGEDFVRSYGTDERFSGKTRSERAVLNFVGNYLDEDDRTYLLTGDYAIKYLDYDWSLNEQKR